jgi:hypothetical protein
METSEFFTDGKRKGLGNSNFKYMMVSVLPFLFSSTTIGRLNFGEGKKILKFLDSSGALSLSLSLNP